MAETFKPVVFKLGNESYGIDINLVNSIENQINVVPVPNALRYIKGIINLRGEVIPVYSLKKKFNMAEADVAGSNTIIVKLPELTLALEVDTVEEIHDIEAANIVDMPVIVKNDNLQYFDRVANVNGKLIVLLDLEHLLTDSEKQSVKNFTEDLNKK